MSAVRAAKAMMDWSDLAYEAEYHAETALFEEDLQEVWETAVSSGHALQWAAVLTLVWLLTEDDDDE